MPLISIFQLKQLRDDHVYYSEKKKIKKKLVFPDYFSLLSAKTANSSCQFPLPQDISGYISGYFSPFQLISCCYTSLLLSSLMVFPGCLQLLSAQLHFKEAGCASPGCFWFTGPLLRQFLLSGFSVSFFPLQPGRLYSCSQ